MKMIHACAIMVLLAGCSQRLDEQVIPDTNRNPAKFVLDVKPTPPAKPSNSTGLKDNIPAAPLPKVGDGHNGRVFKQQTPDATAVEKPQAHSPASSNTKPASRPTVHFHHCLKGCKPCPAAYSWAYHNATHLAGDVVFHEYADLDEAGNAGIPFVPSFEIDGNFVGIDLDRKNHRKHKAGTVCPECINQWIRTGGKWPPGNVQFDKPADVRVAAAKSATTLQFKGYVAQAYGVWDKYVGDNVAVSVEWYRPFGEREFSLWRGEQTDFSPAALLGTDGGRVSVSAPGAKFPITKYMVECKGDANAVYVRGDWIRFGVDGRPAPMAVAQPVGIEPMTILSILSTAIKLMNIHADLIIPKNVQFVISKRGNDFAIGFTEGKGPYARVSHLWNSFLYLPTVALTRDGMTLMLKGPWFLPKRKVIQFANVGTYREVYAIRNKRLALVAA